MASQQFDSAIDEQKVTYLHRHINDWFVRNARPLPWRRDERTAWEVMVSEFMLQQTPVVRVLPVWQQWIERWPAPADLAAVDSSEAVRAWGRLGYPRRALRLHAAAVAIVEKHAGAVPSSYEELLALPGVGSYTAAAISVFAFGRRATVIDTNIRRVHARAVSGKALPHKSLNAAETKLAEALMPQDLGESVLWNAATMELGALICTAKSPSCDACPVYDVCAWIAAGKPEAHYVPKGQSWQGTDRQLRGAMMAVLREAHAPVDAQVLLSAGRRGKVSPDIEHGVLALRKLSPEQEQIDRCFSGLLNDGLAKESDGLISL